jgi:integrase
MLKDGIAAGTVRNYIKSVKLFCQMNDILVNWTKISKGLPKEKQYGDDRIPTIDEIHKLIQYPDRRIRPIVCLMISSGIRAGAWEYLKWKHILPKKIKNQIVAAKIIVYAGEPDEYYTFITSEAFHELKAWMDFRISYGEKITGESWLMRDTWQKIDTRYGNNIGMINYPKKLKNTGIKSLMDRAIRTQKLDIKKKVGYKHNNQREWKALHGFRKLFNTVLANSGVSQLAKEMLMGHDTGLDKNYFRPSENDLLNEYLKAINNLTINEEFRLKQELEELKETQNEVSAMKLKHEKEMKDLRQELNQKYTKLWNLVYQTTNYR